MSDFGSEVGSSSIELGNKLLTALMSLIQKIYETWENAPERQLKQLQIKDLKEKEFVKNIEGKIGYVNYQKMRKAGIPMTPVGINMTKNEMKELSELIKREGIKISALIDERELKNEGKRIYEIICPTKDLEQFAKVVDRLNDERLIVGMEKRIKEISSKNEESLTEQDKVDIEALKQKIKNKQQQYCYLTNDEQAQSIVEQALYNDSKHNMNFDKALNRNTGRMLDKGANCIIVDAKEPNNYICCNGYTDKYKGRTYIKTDYEVYKGNKKVYVTHDGRFDNRPKDYWDKEKTKMKKMGQIGDIVFKFYSFEEYQRWAEHVKAKNEKELNVLTYDGKEGRDYDHIIKELKTYLQLNGAAYKNGTVVSLETQQALILKNDMEIKSKANIGELFVIGRQIENYNELKHLETELAVARTETLITNEGTQEYTIAKENLNKISEKYKQALNTEKDLKEKRMDINAVQVEQENRTVELDDYNEKKFTLKEVQESIDKERQKYSVQDNKNDKEVHKITQINKGKNDR